MLNRRVLIAAVTIAATVAVAVLSWRTWKGDEPIREKPRRLGRDRGKFATKQQPSESNGWRANRMKNIEPDVGAFSNLSAGERRLAESVQTALDSEDYAATLKAAINALNSTNAEVRLHAVEALGWFGKKALAELTPCMADPDEEVAQAAANAWELALSEIDDAKERFDVSLLALTTISAKDSLRTIGGQFANAATDLIADIDDDEKASAKRVEVIQNVVDMIDDEHPARSAAAREIYEEITGHEWIGVAEAERYLSDPENYEPIENTETP